MILRRVVVLISLLFALFHPTYFAAAEENYKFTVKPSNSEFVEPAFTVWPSDFAGQNAYVSVLPICSFSNTNDCIKEIQYQDSNSNWIKGNLKSYFPLDHDPKTDLYTFSNGENSINKTKNSVLPDSARSSIWTFDGIKNSGSNEFLLTVFMLRSGNDSGINTGGKMRISITPMSSSYSTITNDDMKIASRSMLADSSTNTICYLDESALKKYCTKREEFSDLKSIRVVLNFKKHKNIFDEIGWLTARNRATSISIENKSDQSIDVTFEGIPLKINSMLSLRPVTLENFILGRKIWNISRSALTPDENSYAKYDLADTRCFGLYPNSVLPNCNGFFDGTLQGDYQSQDAFAYYIVGELEKSFPVLPFNPSTLWNFETMNPIGSDYSVVSRCQISGQPSGVISSNASLLFPSLPVWNPINNSLDYKIASTHLDPDGSISTGIYEMKVSEKVAKCLWGDDLKNASVEIQILSSGNGQSQTIQVSTLNILNGYLQFAISGFHYSANEIRVKLIQQMKSEITSKSKNSLPNVNATKKSSIVCLKGKSVRQVKAINPVCPTGFKIKI